MGIFLGTIFKDTIRGTQTADVITALGGGDTIFGFGGADVIDGGDGSDTIYTNSQKSGTDGAIDTVLAGRGNDYVYGGYGDILNGGFGNDTLALDLSGSNQGIDVDFRPMTILDLTDLVVIEIGLTQLSGFQSVDMVQGSEFDDRIITGNDDQVASTIDAGAGDDIARGGSGADVINGDAGNDRLVGVNGADTLSGGLGDDRLLGGGNTDRLTGGAGKDQFVFADGDTSRGRENADVITDFSQADNDRILLGGIDAIAGEGNDAFTFIGTDTFSGEAGELRFRYLDGATFVSGDTDGDAAADFTIRLEGEIALVASDFTL